MSQNDTPVPPPDHDDDRDRRVANIFLLIMAAVIVGAGLWLVDAMLAARKADECMAFGRRNCTPVDKPSPR